MTPTLKAAKELPHPKNGATWIGTFENGSQVLDFEQEATEKSFSVILRISPVQSHE
jgi:hypothetical protein